MSLYYNLGIFCQGILLRKINLEGRTDTKDTLCESTKAGKRKSAKRHFSLFVSVLVCVHVEACNSQVDTVCVSLVMSVSLVLI